MQISSRHQFETPNKMALDTRLPLKFKRPCWHYSLHEIKKYCDKVVSSGMTFIPHLVTTGQIVSKMTWWNKWRRFAFYP